MPCVKSTKFLCYYHVHRPFFIIILGGFVKTDNLWLDDIFVTTSTLPHSNHIYKHKCLIQPLKMNTVKHSHMFECVPVWKSADHVCDKSEKTHLLNGGETLLNVFSQSSYVNKYCNHTTLLQTKLTLRPAIFRWYLMYLNYGHLL